MNGTLHLKQQSQVNRTGLNGRVRKEVAHHQELVKTNNNSTLFIGESYTAMKGKTTGECAALFLVFFHRPMTRALRHQVVFSGD